MSSLNKVQIIGRLAKDPDFIQFENGGSITSFSLATNESYFDKEKNQRVDLPTDWHNIRISQPGIGKVAMQYLKKGNRVFVQGAIRYREYQTKEGEIKRVAEIYVDNLVLLDSKPRESGPSPSGQVQNEQPPVATPPPFENDDLPF